MNDSVRVPVIPDGKGYYDRQCPNNECEYVFKVLMEDWMEKILDEVVYCPMCGYTADSDQWYTEEQQTQLHKVAISFAESYISQELGKMFNNLERSTRGNKNVSIKYKPGRPVSFVNNPIGQREEWALDITCTECGTRYSVIGSAYFCPCCGHNAVDKVFLESLDTVDKQISSIDEIKDLFTKQFGADKAETMCRTMVEGTLADIVSAFQKYAESRFSTLCERKVKVNDFQRVSDGCSLFRDNLGKGYEAWLTQEELDTMNLMFQRRHILEHNNGLVDTKYIEKTRDTSYRVGQRLVVRSTDTLQLLAIIRKLGDGLGTLTAVSDEGATI